MTTALTGMDYKFAQRGNWGGRIHFDQDAGAQWRGACASEGRSYAEILADSDAIVQVDISSSYPYAMLNAYPKGEHTAVTDPVAAEEAYRAGKHGMFSVSFIVPANLKRGVLPIRGKTKMSWPTAAGTVGEGVFTEVDLRLAEQKGYQWSFTGEALVWAESSTTLFADFVTKLTALKVQYEEDKPVRKVLKNITTRLYGKLGQKVSGSQTNNYKVISTETAEELLFSGDKDKIESMREDGGQWWLRSMGKKNTHPNHLGSYVLSYSRVHLHRLMDLIDYDNHFVSTDALRVSVAQYLQLQAAGWIDPVAIGKLKVERLILAYAQTNVNDYEVLELLPSGERVVVLKGKSSNRRVHL